MHSTQDRKIELNPLVDNRFYLACHINKRPCKFLIDTGAKKSRICTQLARNLNLPENCNHGRNYVEANLDMGQIKKTCIQFYLEDENCRMDRINAMLSEVHLDGIIGIDFLRWHTFSFDYRDYQHPRAFLDSHLDLTNKSYLQIERDEYSRPHVFSQISGKQCKILLDTGANHSEINFQDEQWTLKKKNAPYGTPTSYEINKDLVIAIDLTLSLAPNHTTKFSPLIIEGEEEPLLGIETLRGYVFQYEGEGRYAIGK